MIIFFQAEDGIRDADVTGVQTCALPILFPWKMTMAQAKYLQITGNSISGAQAAEWGWVIKSFPADDLEDEVARELHVLRNIDPSIMAANKMAVNQAYEVMGFRTHLEQSW